MTASPPQSRPQAPPPSRWSAGRIVALVIGVVLLLPAIGLLLGGGVLLWADRSQRSGDYLTTDSESFTTSGFALTTDQVDLSTGADWLPVSSSLGTARLQVTGTDPGTAVFVGIARSSDASTYLQGVQRTVLNDIGTGANTQVAVPGGAPSGPPGEQDFWVAKASGPGTQQLTWAPEQGNWTVIVMNSDASAGVSVQARIGATVPALGRLAWGLVGAGLLLAVIGVLLVVLAVRRPSRGAGSPFAGQPIPQPAGPPPAGPPPAWQSPAPRPTSEPTAAPDAAHSGPPTSEEPPG